MRRIKDETNSKWEMWNLCLTSKHKKLLVIQRSAILLASERPSICFCEILKCDASAKKGKIPFSLFCQSRKKFSSCLLHSNWSESDLIHCLSLTPHTPFSCHFARQIFSTFALNNLFSLRIWLRSPEEVFGAWVDNLAYFVAQLLHP